MKALRSFLTVFVLLFLSAAVAMATPHAIVERPTFDFGKIAHGEKVEHVFVLKNNGNSPLSIGQVSSSCGCTVAEVSSRSIPPGKSSEIRVTFNSTNFSGDISKTVHVHTNDPKTPVYTLSMKGTVIEEIEVAPKQLNLGEIKIGSRRNVSVTIENKSDRAIAVTSVKSNMPQITIKAKKATLKPGTKTTVKVIVTPGNQDRFLGGYLYIRTNSPSKPEIIIPVYASVTK